MFTKIFSGRNRVTEVRGDNWYDFLIILSRMWISFVLSCAVSFILPCLVVSDTGILQFQKPSFLASMCVRYLFVQLEWLNYKWNLFLAHASCCYKFSLIKDSNACWQCMHTGCYMFLMYCIYLMFMIFSLGKLLCHL